MIDKFIIFSKTGILLWSFTEHEPKGDPVNGLIQDVLLQERAGMNEHIKDVRLNRSLLAAIASSI